MHSHFAFMRLILISDVPLSFLGTIKENHWNTYQLPGNDKAKRVYLKFTGRLRHDVIL